VRGFHLPRLMLLGKWKVYLLLGGIMGAAGIIVILVIGLLTMQWVKRADAGQPVSLEKELSEDKRL
jgi:hypothetical protein